MSLRGREGWGEGEGGGIEGEREKEKERGSTSACNKQDAHVHGAALLGHKH